MSIQLTIIVLYIAVLFGISFYAKRARGLMVKYAAEQQITAVEQLKQFDSEGYAYSESDSSSNTWVFRREERQK